MVNLYELVRYSQGEASCQHCGTGIKNIYTIRNTQTQLELHVGSECVQKLLEVESLPKEFKQLEKEFKNRKFNESILNMITSVHPSFLNSNLGKALILGTQKATDKAFLNTFLIRQYYSVTNIPYWVNRKGSSCQERVKTQSEFQTEISALASVKFLSEYAATKECKKFIGELISYAEEHYRIWGWTVKYEIIKENCKI